jgi:hypothetical protein
MKPALALLAAAVMATSATAQTAPAAPKSLTLEHRMLLRCSAAFALLANRQAANDPAAQAWPALGKRGSEFFVRASARVMDEAQLDRAAIAEALTVEARSLAAGGTLSQVMPACLATLEASGL